MKQDPIIVHYALPLTSNCVSLEGTGGHPVTLYNLLFSKNFWTNWTILRIRIEMLKIYLFLSLRIEEKR